jgi:hypothetical protein
MLDHRGAPIYRDTRLRGHMCALRSDGLVAVSRSAKGSSAVLREAAIRFRQWCVGARRRSTWNQPEPTAAQAVGSDLACGMGDLVVKIADGKRRVKTKIGCP